MTTYYMIQCWRYDYDEWESENLYESFDDACDAMDEEIRNYHEYTFSEYKKPNCEEKFKQIQERGYAVYHRSTREHEFIIKTMKVVPKKDTYEELDCSEQDKHLETHFDEIFKRSKKAKTLNGRPVRNLWYDPSTRWAYQVYFQEGEKPHTFYDPESNIIHAIEFEKKYVYQYFVENDYKGITSLSLKASQKYASFDEACDAMDKELSELYEVDGKEPLQRNRLVIKTLLGKSSRITYASYNDGGPTTDKYVLSRQEV